MADDDATRGTGDDALHASGHDALRAVGEDALRFLSHDAREGHSSTLALIELQRIKAEPVDTVALMAAVERNARRSLAAIDDFVALAHARTQALRPDEVDLAALLAEHVADVWPLATEHGVRVHVDAAPDTAPCIADRELLGAALTRLLRDVIERAPRGAVVDCALHAPPGEWVITLRGAGDARDTTPSAGRALADVVLARQGGRVELDVPLASGATAGGLSPTWRLVLPRR